MTEHIENISPEVTKELLNKGLAILIDVREQEEYDEAHIEGAIHLPLSSFDPFKVPETTENQKIIFYCRTGPRAENACALYMGYTNKSAICMNGSITAWKDLGYPVV